MICPVCIVGPMAMGGAYVSIFKSKLFWIGLIIMVLSALIYYKYKDCDTCQVKKK